MWSELFGDLIRRLISKIPGWLVGCFYPSDKIAKLIDIDLRSNVPIILNLNADVPYISLYFSINNRSPFEITLDRLLIKLWINQPVLDGFILRRDVVSKGNFRDNIYFSSFLTALQREVFKKHCDGQLMTSQISLEVTAYLESKIGLVCVEKRIDRSEVPCR